MCTLTEEIVQGFSGGAQQGGQGIAPKIAPPLGRGAKSPPCFAI